MDRDNDPGWLLVDDGGGSERPFLGAIFTTGSFGFATRGAAEFGEEADGTYASGVYVNGGPEQALLLCPDWTHLDISAADAPRRTLDLRDGVLISEYPSTELRIERFIAADRPGLMLLRAESPDFVGPDADWTSSVHGVDAGVTAAITQECTIHGSQWVLERVAAMTVGRPAAPPPQTVFDALSRLKSLRFDAFLDSHRRAWAERWETVSVDLPDDPDLEFGLRHSLFQLWCNAVMYGEAGVGARGISGSGYSGHVFWDSDVFVLPAVATMDPAAARAMVQYRLNRLPAALQRAKSEGRRGARFPWESAASGDDVTPVHGYIGGEPVPIRTGLLEEHITAAVAWALDHYAEWTGDSEFIEKDARPLLTETARYWASRCRIDEAGTAHIDGVIGPDEYHEAVDDNAYTNVMARWNLRRAARLRPLDHREAAEFEHWRDIAARLVDQLDNDGLYEQFSGYFALEDLKADSFATPPFAADILLGVERVRRSQLIKQPDVLMLHHLVPHEVATGSLDPNLDYYGPRTTHGSSLSPAIMAALYARAGRFEKALPLLRHAARIDLDDLTNMTSGGLHLASLGGAWVALLTGFVGARVQDGVLHLDPRLPEVWRNLTVRFTCLGTRVAIRLAGDQLELRTDGPLRVRVRDTEPVLVLPERTVTFARENR